MNHNFIPELIRTLTILMACTACGGLLRLYMVRRTSSMPVSASVSVILLFGYVIGSEQAHYSEALAWYDFMALAGVVVAHVPLFSLLSFNRHVTSTRKKSES